MKAKMLMRMTMSDMRKLADAPLGRPDDRSVGGGGRPTAKGIALSRQKLEAQPAGWPADYITIGPAGGGKLKKDPPDVIENKGTGQGTAGGR